MIAVLFEAETRPDAQARYLELAEALKPELKNIDGFIAIERFHSLNTPGKILSLSWWRDAEAVLTWKNHMSHLAAQKEGRQAIFASYRIRVAEVLRDYSLNTGAQHDV